MVSIIISGNQIEEAPPLGIFQLDQTGAQEFTVQWQTVVGADYQIESSTDLLNFTQVGDDFNAIREQIVEPVPAPTPERFWRIKRLDD